MTNILATVLLALTSHVVFCHYEPTAAVIASLFVIGSSVFLFVTSGTAALSFDAFLQLAITILIYNATLFTSIGVYRVFFHRIKGIPGPLSSSLSKLATVPIDLAGKRPSYITQLHEKFGDVVRIGPREVSINDVAAINAVMGSNSGCRKGPWYEAMVAGRSARSSNLHWITNLADHRIRRKAWDRAFNSNSMKDYNSQIKETNEEFMSHLEKFAKDGQIVAIDQWCQFFSFDLTGLLGFSRSFALMEKGGFIRPIELLESAMGMVMVLGHIPWFASIAKLTPSPIKQFEDFCEKALKEKVDRGTSSPDLMSHLLDESHENAWKYTWDELISETQLIVVAGSDTASSTLTMLLYLLVAHSEYLDQLRNELDGVFGDEDANDFDRLAKDCPLLNAVISETLRLFPSVPSGLQRITPTQGLTIMTQCGPLVLPGDIIASIPTTTIHRDPRYFSPRPNAFRPERWLRPDEEEAFVKEAFIPFGYGPGACVGKVLAWQEMRLVLASIVGRFDLSFATGFDSKSYPDCIKDNFTAARSQPLRMAIKKRQQRLNPISQ